MTSILLILLYVPASLLQASGFSICIHEASNKNFHTVSKTHEHDEHDEHREHRHSKDPLEEKFSFEKYGTHEHTHQEILSNHILPFSSTTIKFTQIQLTVFNAPSRSAHFAKSILFQSYENFKVNSTSISKILASVRIIV